MLTVDEEHRILEAAPPHLRVSIVLLVQTGGRTYSEGLSLGWDQVYLVKNLSAASGDVAYAKTHGATNLSNWTDVGPKALSQGFGATPSCVPCGFSSSRCPGSSRTCEPSYPLYPY